MLRDFIMRKAAESGCLSEVWNLPEIEAIRLIQQKECNKPCYADEIPFTPELYGDPRCCGKSDCCWKMPCDKYRLVDSWKEGKILTRATYIVEKVGEYSGGELY